MKKGQKRNKNGKFSKKQPKSVTSTNKPKNTPKPWRR